MKFYSGKGDGGTSTLFGSGKRTPKNSPIFEALGSVDELNSYLGVCKSLSKDKKIISSLGNVQENLFIIQAQIGGARDIPEIGEKRLKDLEKETDKLGGGIGLITKFTIPGEDPMSAHLDYARTVARRAERACVNLGNKHQNTIAYLNRLSSLLFVMARFVAKKNGAIEKNPKYK